ncbi:MAG TPA: class II aldolase/adducin family protein [Spirochaetia bacterium]|nr:class II aldolase/adducin family protein [Spirochaetia bacterium]
MRPRGQEYALGKFRTIGKAINRVFGNNTHSGNLSLRDPADPDVFYISASGSQIGNIVPRDIVPLRISDVSWGDARGSTESTIHRKVLQIEGVGAVVHAHYLGCTSISFDTREKQMFLRYLGTDTAGREEFLFHPVDLFGSHIVGGVRVASYRQPVGSAEMEERIPLYLAENPLTIVRGHGPFARGVSLEDCLYRLSVLELSARLILNLRRRGVPVVALQTRLQEQGPESFFPATPHLLDEKGLSVREVEDETVAEDFRLWLEYNYNNLIGAYGTGSMSHKVAENEMIYCPMSAVPEGMDFPLTRISLESSKEDCADLRIHKLIYRHTHQNACMITMSPLAVSEGLAVLAERFGEDVLTDSSAQLPYTADDHPFIRPIDAEALYLNPRLGLVDSSLLADGSGGNPVLDMLRWYKGCCVIAGYGVVSTGETTLEQAAHNASSAERIARFRAEVYLNEKLLGGPSLEDAREGQLPF